MENCPRKGLQESTAPHLGQLMKMSDGEEAFPPEAQQTGNPYAL